MQYARSKVDYVIGEKMYMIPSDMNLQIEKIKNYNNKILESKSYFKLGINKKINLDEEKGKPDAKPKSKPNIKSNKEHKQDVEPNIWLNKKHKQDVEPYIRLNKECKEDVKMIRTKPDTNKITYEEEKVALVLGMTTIFTVWWMFKWLPFPCLCHEICVYQNTNTCYESP